MTGIGTGKCQRHHRVEVPVRAERGDHDLHVVMVSDSATVVSHRVSVLHYQAAIASLMPTLPLTPDELLTTTRSVRKRLDLTRPCRLILSASALKWRCRRPRPPIDKPGIGW